MVAIHHLLFVGKGFDLSFNVRSVVYMVMWCKNAITGLIMIMMAHSLRQWRQRHLDVLVKDCAIICLVHLASIHQRVVVMSSLVV